MEQRGAERNVQGLGLTKLFRTSFQERNEKVGEKVHSFGTLRTSMSLTIGRIYTYLSLCAVYLSFSLQLLYSS
jgi:hypothetical protein